MPALDEAPEDAAAKGERIAKIIARSGLCSRRDAEVLIGEKRVSVNGAVIESAALDVLPSDKVLVDGKPLAAPQPPRLWRYHKPKGRVTTHKDPEGRPTVFEGLPEGLPRLISVGRLDFNTEGLLLLTNDGDLARHLELPSTGWTRRYRVRAFGQIDQSNLDELAAGLRTGGVNYGPIEATLEREQGDNVWITLAIREGKNREVRRIMEHLGLTVNRLIRVSFGPFMLGDLEPGQIEEVKTSVLKDQLGPRLARQLGVKREPLREERRLSPARSKPTYLRRKQDVSDKPERLREERPMRRRRIHEAGSTEAAKVELVPDRRQRPDRFKKAEGAPERRFLRRRGEETGGDDREHQFGRGQRRRAEARLARDGGERGGEEGHSGNAGDRPRWKSRAGRGSEGARPHFRQSDNEQHPKAAPERGSEGGQRGEKRPYKPRRTEEGQGGGDRPEGRFRRRNGEQRPKFASEGRREGGSTGEKRPYKPRRTEEGHGGGDRPEGRFRRRNGEQRPKFASEGRREDGNHGEKSPYRSRREEGHRGGDRPKFGRRFQSAEGGPEERQGAYRNREGGPREAAGEAPGRRAPREEGRGPKRPGKFAGASGGRKPRSFGKRASPGARAEGDKGFKPRASSAHKPRPGGPRKPRPHTREDTP